MKSKSIFGTFFLSLAVLLVGRMPANSKPTPVMNNGPSQKRLLTRDEAIAYAVELVNRDRAKYHRKPVSVDAVAALAGQKHSDEMVINGYLSHWDLAGKKPDQRYTECGGTNFSSENAGFAAFHPPKVSAQKGIFQLKDDHRYLATDIEDLESDFMNEKAPNDGHRQNILDPMHNKLGIGISFSESGTQSRIAISQEFVDHYGEFEKIPANLKRGEDLVISGELSHQMKLYEVKIEMEPIPTARTAAQLDSGPRSCHNEGLPIRDYVAGQDPDLKMWTVDANLHFLITVKIDENWQTGLYYIEILAKPNLAKKDIPISVRTALLE